MENENPDAAAAFDFEWMNAKRAVQLWQGQKGHRPVQNKWTDVCAWVYRLLVLSEIGLFCFARPAARLWSSMIRERQKLTDGCGLLLPAAAPLKVLRGDSDGCIGLSGPVPAMPRISPPDQKCPVRWSSPLRNGAAVALTSSICFGLTSIDSIWPGETASFLCFL